MLMNFDNGTFLCHDFQLEMFEQLRANHPSVYADILKEVEAAKASHPSHMRDVDVSIYGQFEKNQCRKVIKTMETFNQFSSFKVQSHTSNSATVQNSEYITDSIVIHAN